MTWFKVDDRWHSHRKVIPLSLEARGLWATLGSWCADQLNGGHVPRDVLKHFGGKRAVKLALALVHEGLWRECEDGYQFHDWDDHQPTKDAVLAKREATKLRVQRHRNAVGNGVTNSVGNASPVPTRPDPSNSLTEPDSYPSCADGADAHTRPSVTGDDPETDRRRGNDFMLRATTKHWQGYDHDLVLIGMKPRSELLKALEAIQADPWCQANMAHCNPKHVLRKWNVYSSGNKPMQPVALKSENPQDRKSVV